MTGGSPGIIGGAPGIIGGIPGTKILNTIICITKEQNTLHYHLGKYWVMYYKYIPPPIIYLLNTVNHNLL